MSLWAVELGWTGESGVVMTEIVLVVASGPYDADQRAMSVLHARGLTWPWTTGHRWLLAGEEYVG